MDASTQQVHYNSNLFESFTPSSEQNKNYNEGHNEFNYATQSVESLYEAQHSFASGDFGRKGEWESNERGEGGDFYRMDEMRGSGMEFGEPDRRRGTMYRGNLHDDSRGREHTKLQGRGRGQGHSEFRGRGRGRGPGQYGSARGWEGGRGGIQQRQHPINKQNWKEEEFEADFDITKLREPEIFQFPTDDMATNLKESTTDMAKKIEESACDSQLVKQEDDAPGDNLEVVKTNPVAIVKEQDPGKEEKKEDETEKEEDSKEKSINSESKDENQMPSNNKTNKKDETEETRTDIVAEDACKDQSNEDALEEEAMEAENILEPICKVGVNSKGNFKDHAKGKLHKMNFDRTCQERKSEPVLFSRDELGKSSFLEAELKKSNEEEIYIGLSYVTEYQHMFYIKCICHLCASSFACHFGLKHLTGLRHCLNVLREKRPDFYADNMTHRYWNRTKVIELARPLIEEINKEEGPGTPTIKVLDDTILEVQANNEEDSSPDIKMLSSKYQTAIMVFLRKEMKISRYKFAERAESGSRFQGKRPFLDSAIHGDPRDVRGQHPRMHPPEPHGPPMHGPPNDPYFGHPHPPFLSRRHPMPDPDFDRPHYPPRPPIPDPYFRTRHMRGDLYHNPETLRRMRRDYPYHDRMPTDPRLDPDPLRLKTDEVYLDSDPLKRLSRSASYLDPDPMKRLSKPASYLDPDPMKRLSRPASYLDPDPVKRLTKPASYLDPDPVKRLSKAASCLDPDPLKRVSRAEVYSSNRYNFDEPYIDPDPLKRVLPSQKAAKKPIVIDYAHGSEKKSAKNTAGEWEKDLKDILTESKGPDSLAQLSCSYSSPKREDTPPTTPPRQVVKPLLFSKSYMERSKLLQQESNSAQKERSTDSRKRKDDRRQGKPRSPNRKYRCSEYRGSESPEKARHKSKGKGKTSSYDSIKHSADSPPRRHAHSRSPEETGSYYRKCRRLRSPENVRNEKVDARRTYSRNLEEEAFSRKVNTAFKLKDTFDKRTLQSRNEENASTYSNPDFRRKPQLLGPVIDLTNDEELRHPIKEETPPSEKSPEKPALEKEPAMEASAAAAAAAVAAAAADDDDDDDDVQADMIAEVLLNMKNSIVGEDADPATALKAILSNDITQVLIAAKKATEKQMENRFVNRQENYFEADQSSLERSRREKGSDRNSLERSRQERGSDRNSLERSRQERKSDRNSVERSRRKRGSDRNSLERSIQERGSDRNSLERSRQERGSDRNSLERSIQERGSDRNSLERSRQERGSDRNSLEMSKQERGSDRNSLEMSKQQRRSDRNSLERSRQERGSDRNSLEIEMSRQQRESDRNSLEMNGQPRGSDRNSLERSRQERESDRNSLEMSRQQRGSDRNSLEMSRQLRGGDKNSLEMSSQSSLERRREERMRDQENPKRGREVKIRSSRMQNELIRPKENPPPPPREKIVFAFSARSLTSRSALQSFADEEEDD